MKVYAYRDIETKRLFGVEPCASVYEAMFTGEEIQCDDYESKVELHLCTPTPFISTDKRFMQSFLNGGRYFNGKSMQLMIHSKEEIEIVEMELNELL